MAAAKSYKFTHSRPVFAASHTNLQTPGAMVHTNIPDQWLQPGHTNLHIPDQRLQPRSYKFIHARRVVAALVIEIYTFPARRCSQVIQVYRLPVQWLQPLSYTITYSRPVFAAKSYKFTDSRYSGCSQVIQIWTLPVPVVAGIVVMFYRQQVGAKSCTGRSSLKQFGSLECLQPSVQILQHSPFLPVCPWSWSPWMEV